ncbi:FecR domain-containing protein [Chitinophaga niabensis]|uniref:FecR family protein n=1 Tax=Chitinophaga niabensis TaxID=536979 RepID=UPI0031BA2AC7
MNRSRLYAILEKIKKGNSTKEERDLLVQWYEAADEADAEELFDEVGDIIDRMDLPSLKTLEMQLSDTEMPRVIPIRNRWRRLGIAAAVLILVFSTIGVYRSFKGSRLSMTVYSTGKGETRHIRLPDGSEVTLNASSALKVPESFLSEERSVFLKGEAFFSVSKSEKLPFSVLSEDSVLVKVLGTSFNINAYSSNIETKVAVLTGKVAISKADQQLGLFSAGQQLIYNKDSRLFSRTNEENADAWLKGTVAFRGNTLNEVVETLSRVYNKEIALKPGVNGELQFTGNFEKELGIDNILKMVCALHSLEYTYKNNQIVISRKQL